MKHLLLALGVSLLGASSQAAPQTVVQPAVPKRALYEPARGVYLGAALNFSEIASSNSLPRAAMTNVMRDWETKSGRKNAIYTQFIQFPASDGAFPTWESDPRGWATTRDFCEAANTLGATPLITLEPMQPAQFARDWKPGSRAYDAALAFAKSAGAWKKPLFIRWAHEMNGSWYPWAEWIDLNRNLKRDGGEDTGFTAQDYRAAYRNVALMFRQYAPNAALVWCPNSGLLGGERRDVYRPFYPGDDVVDWVALDVYERGWTMPQPGAHLWGGQFEYNLSHDMADDPQTPVNESVDFYSTFAESKNKPMMICETGATLSFRTDLPMSQRAEMNAQWKTAYWNGAEYGWLQAIYGTSAYAQKSGSKLLNPIDVSLPFIKAITYFQVGKHETIPVEKTVAGQTQIVWFDDAWTDYRIGRGADKNSAITATSEIELFRSLTNSPYFLTKLEK